MERLNIELETALLRELRSAFGEVNRSHFKGALKPATIELSDAVSRLGRWNAETRSIEIARSLVLEHSWGTVVEVLKHEMAHQYAHEVLDARSEAAHGPAFRQICARLGIDPAASGLPFEHDGKRDQPILERIARLLALAESSNAHEAEAAASAAQRLMLKYNLDVVKGGSSPAYGFRHIGKATGRVSESERVLAGILGEHFFVDVIWVPVYRVLEGKRGHVLEICGTRANLEMAAYVHAFLTDAAERLWSEHRRSQGLTSNRDRRTYLAGVMAGFGEKLRTDRIAHRQEGLVWVRDGDLARYYRQRHPHIRSTRYGGNERTAAHAEGRAAGRKLVLHRGIQAEARSAGRLLPRASGR